MQKENRLVKSRKSVVVVGLVVLALPALCGDALKETFRTPPLSARPLVWWSWPNGLLSHEAQEHELRALKEQGFGGAQIYDSGNMPKPWGDAMFNTPKWKEGVVFAVRKAEELGLELGLNHVSGWNGTSGPWITSAEAMKKVVCASVEVTGPKAFDETLPALAAANLFRRDIKVLAYPVSETELHDRTRFAVTSPLTDDAALLAKLSGGRWAGEVPIPSDAAKSVFEFTAENPERVAGIELQLTGNFIAFGKPGLRMDLSYLDETGKWIQAFSTGVRLSGSGLTREARRRHPISPVAARRFRVAFTTLVPDRKPVLGALRLYSSQGVSDLERKNLTIVGISPETPVGTVDATALDRNAAIDLTDRVSSDGRLAWQVPAGTWRIVRFGFVDSMRRSNTGSSTANGPLCDVMDAKVVGKHFATLLEPLVDLVHGKDRRFRTTGLTHAFFDSFEGCYQNWCADFAEEFETRNGYSFLPYLPLFDGRTVGSVAESERVLWDYRQTAAALICERYGAALRDESHRLGLRLYHEGVGDGNVDTIDFTLCGDVPMSEFWMANPDHGNIPPIVSAAHLSGNPLVASEAFTAGPENLGWGHDALRLKQATDPALAAGANRFVYHCFIHNPFAAKYRPGIRKGHWGTHMEPTQTWWEHVGASIAGYQGRASALLQAGRPVVDALVFTGEGAPNAGRIGGANLPTGVRADFINRSLVLKLTVEDGDLVLPSGVRYRMLVFPRGVCRAMTPELMERLVALAKDGARLVLPELPTRSPSFRGYPACDVRVRELAKELAPHLFARQTPEAFKKAGIAPDVTFEGLDGVRWNHTRYPDGSESYFLARTNGVAACGTASFRTTGTAIELWDAETGDIVSTDGRVADGRTTVDLSFKPTGSVFVMFRPQPTEGAKPQWKGRETAAREVAGPWNVTFPVGWYYNEPDVKSIEMKTLADWTTLDDPDLKYFSGAATYRTVAGLRGLEKGERVFLDLGVVKNFAVVTVNGTTYPVLWRPPYRVDVTDAVRAAADGKLDLSVRVTNLWPNRLIGDAALPTDCKWHPSGKLLEIPDWVKKGEKSPTGRHTFMTYNLLIKKDMPLLPSGLIGPVRFMRGTMP